MPSTTRKMLLLIAFWQFFGWVAISGECGFVANIPFECWHALHISFAVNQCWERVWQSVSCFVSFWPLQRRIQTNYIAVRISVSKCGYLAKKTVLSCASVNINVDKSATTVSEYVKINWLIKMLDYGARENLVFYGQTSSSKNDLVVMLALIAQCC